MWSKLKRSRDWKRSKRSCRPSEEPRPPKAPPGMLLLYCIAILIALISFLALLYIEQKTQSKQDENGKLPIPGMLPTHPEEGNIPDIKAAKTMTLFLRELHKQFGPIASFWQAHQFCVSVASPEFLKPQRHLFDMPEDCNEPFRILVHDDSLGLINGEEAKRRRKLYDQHFMLKGCKSYCQTFLEIAREYIDIWKQLKQQDHLPLSKNILQASITAILRTSYGNYFKNGKSIKEFQDKLDWVNDRLENPPEPESDEEKTLLKYVMELREIVKQVIENRRNQSDDQEKLFVDVLLGDDVTESQRICDGITFIFAGYETIGRIMVCAIYESAKQMEIQEKIYEEIESELGNEPINQSNMGKLKFLRQVIDETMRLRSTAEYTGRKTEEELQLGNYVVPPNTNIYHELGVISRDPAIWKKPFEFNPDRFTSEKCKERDPLAFKPFGFAGKRQCPGQVFAISEAIIFLGEWFRQFRFHLVPGQTVNIFLAVTLRPEEEIWVTLERRTQN